MEAALYIQESMLLSDILSGIRNELTNAIREAMLRNAYDTDIHLSFGIIHVNARGSVSQISFNGADVTDMDAFVVKQAFQITDDNYYDLRLTIKETPEDFVFYPILAGNKMSLTVLKSSPFFLKKYGRDIYCSDFQIEYVSKYIIIRNGNSSEPQVYFIGLFGALSTANTLLDKAGKSIGGNSIIYYCFMNIRPELFLHLGQVKSDFAAYKPEKNEQMYNFYRGSVLGGIFYVNRKTDVNGKIKVKETRKACIQLIIKMQYGSIATFCDAFDIDKFFLTTYLSGAGNEIKYCNGNTISPTRLEKILNIPFSIDAEGLENKNLLVKVNYDDIPA